MEGFGSVAYWGFRVGYLKELERKGGKRERGTTTDYHNEGDGGIPDRLYDL
jgi:hypothetical protein